MKLYAQLQVHPCQRAVMAERWRSWCRRRRGLDKQLWVALQHLQVLSGRFDLRHTHFYSHEHKRLALRHALHTRY
jgi:hypothetical protein